jgi:hypothetical protein
MQTARKIEETNHPGHEKVDMRQGGTVRKLWLCLTTSSGLKMVDSERIESDLAQTTASLGRFKRSLALSLQRIHDSKSVALVTEKVRSPRNEIISFTLHHVGIGGSTIGTLRLRVRFHFPCSLFSEE